MSTFALVAFLIATRQEPKALTLEIPACRIEVLLEKLSSATGKHLELAPRLRGEVIAIRVADVKADELLARVAKVMFAQWTATHDGLLLEQPPNLRLSEERAEHAARLAVIKPAIEKRKAEIASDAALTPQETKRFLNAIVRSDEEALKGADKNGDFSGLTSGVGIEIGRNRTALERLQSRIGVSFDPDTLADIPLHERIVFSTRPNRMQRSNPALVGILNDFIREKRAFAQAAAHLPPQILPKDANGRPRTTTPAGFFDRQELTRDADEVVKALVVVEVTSDLGISFSISLLRRDGSEAYDCQQVLERVRTDGGGNDAPAPDRSIQVSQSAKDNVQAIMDLGDLERGHGKEPNDSLKNPERDEPLGLFASDVLFADHSQRNILARMPDSCFELFLTIAREDAPSVKQLHRMIAQSSDLSIEEDGTWTVLTPKLPVTCRTNRCDRRQLAELVDSRAPVNSLDLLVQRIHGLPNPEVNLIALVYLMEGGEIKIMEDLNSWRDLQLLGALSPIQRQLLWNRGSFTFSELSNEAKNLLYESVFNDVLALRDSPLIEVDATGLGPSTQGGYPVSRKPFIVEPTEVLHEGIPGFTRFSARITSDTVARPVANPEIAAQSLSAFQLGDRWAAMESRERATVPNFGKIKFSKGARETMLFQCQLGPELFFGDYINFAAYIPGEFTLDSFSAEFRQAVQKARLEYKDTEERRGPPAQQPPP